MYFLTNIFNGSKLCLALLKTAGLLVPNRNFREFSSFNVDLKRRKCPSARCTSAANAIGNENV